MLVCCPWPIAPNLLGLACSADPQVHTNEESIRHGMLWMTTVPYACFLLVFGLLRRTYPRDRERARSGMASAVAVSPEKQETQEAMPVETTPLWAVRGGKA